MKKFIVLIIVLFLGVFIYFEMNLKNIDVIPPNPLTHLEKTASSS